jgi:hypothetical protein
MARGVTTSRHCVILGLEQKCLGHGEAQWVRQFWHRSAACIQLGLSRLTRYL